LKHELEQLRDEQGYQRGYQEAIKETTIKRLQAVVYIDRTKQAAYEQPSPNTDPFLQRRLEAQKRKNDMKTFLHIDDSRELPSIPRITAPATARSGELSKYVKTHVTGALKPIKLGKPTQQLDPDGFLL
jgi:hypothetical protein